MFQWKFTVLNKKNSVHLSLKSFNKKRSKFFGRFAFLPCLKVGSLKDLISCGIDGNDAPTAGTPRAYGRERENKRKSDGNRRFQKTGNQRVA